MDLQDTLEELEATLAALERVLAEEFSALRVLDTNAIERASAEKIVLDRKLRSFGDNLPRAPRIEKALKRLRGAAQVNQALLIHARACLKGAIETAAGRPVESISYARPLSENASVRINVRG